MSPEYLIYVIAALQVADAATTLAILSGGGRELNPVVAFLIDLFGAETALIAKGSLIVWLCYGADVQSQCWVIGIYVLVVVWNLYQLKKIRGN